jgi:hypothetical protein
MKFCPKCKEKKELDKFYVNRGTKRGCQSYCISCHKTSSKESTEKRKIIGPTVIRNAKICKLCNEKKPISQFGIRRNVPDGHLSYCKPCWTVYVQKAKKKSKKLNTLV